METMDIQNYKELKKIFPDLPPVTEEMRLELHRRCARAYLLYRKHKKTANCFCTSCMTRFEMSAFEPALKNKGQLLCPKCGRFVWARPDGISRANISDSKLIAYFIPTENAVFAICAELYGGYGTKQPVEYMAKYYGGHKLYIYYVVRYEPGGARMASCHYYFGAKETLPDNLYEPYVSNGGSMSKSVYFEPYNPEILKQTFLKYYTESPCNKFLLYLMYAVKYPAVEMLAKSGGAKLLQDIIDRKRPYKSVLNLNGKTPAEVFKTDSNEAAIIKRALPGTGIDTLQCYRRLKALGKRTGHKYTLDDAALSAGMNLPYNEVVKILDMTGLTSKKLKNYIDRQSESGVKGCIGLYKDYIGECVRLGYDLRDTQISKPRSLTEAHARTSDAVRALEDEIKAKQYAEKQAVYLKNYKKLCKKYCYSDGIYSIIVPTCALDIIREGRLQRHCVGGYAERHLIGKLTILFLRKAAEPDTPLYTIEMQDKRLMQIRGYQNADPDGEAMEFVDKWLKTLKRRIKKSAKTKEKISA